MRLGKTQKTLTPEGGLILYRRMIGLEQQLCLDRESCCGCGDCQTICPTEAITSSESVVADGCLVQRAALDIDPEACIFCGQCVVICPTKSFQWRENQQTTPTVISKEILPSLAESIEVNVAGCRSDCGLVCGEACPVKAIKVKTSPEGQAEGAEILDVEVDREHCLYCGQCRTACPNQVIQVKSARFGLVVFSPEHCPSGCQACSQVCPTQALHLEDGQVQLNDSHCIYCRACLQVCPVDEALEVKRERLQGRPLQSHLWMEMQGKLVSQAAKFRLIEQESADKRIRALHTRMD